MAVIIAICVVLVVIGAAMVVRWGGLSYGRPEEGSNGTDRWVYVADGWAYFFTVLAAGLVAGMLAAGAGGRLVMRLLAATSPDAKGAITEFEATVGEITVGGTLALFTFGGVAAGLLSAALFALVRPLLPTGRAGGLAFGVLLLVLAGTRLEPLRADNPDFQIVGPGWLAVLAFTALGLFQGMLVVALGARMSSSRALRPGLAASFRPRLVLVGRIALGVLVLVAVPSFVGSVADILG